MDARAAGDRVMHVRRFCDMCEDNLEDHEKQPDLEGAAQTRFHVAFET